MFYRPYHPDDFTPLYALEEQCFEPADRFSRRYMRSLVTRANSATWIAEEQGTIKGFAIVEWRERRNEIAAYIQTLEVDPNFRRHGAGRELLARIEASARSAGAALIRLHVEAANAAAIRLYESQGYRCEGRRENYYPEGRAALLYVKPLTAITASSTSLQDRERS